MKLISTTILSGFNLHAPRSVICLKVAFGTVSELDLSKWDGSVLKELAAIVPELGPWLLGPRPIATKGASLVDLIWKAALVFQERVGERGLVYGQTIDHSEGFYDVVYEYRDSLWGWKAGQLAATLVHHVLPMSGRVALKPPVAFAFEVDAKPEDLISMGEPVDPDTALILELADRRGIPWRRSGSSLARLGQGAHQRTIMGGATDALGWVNAWRSGHDEFAHRRLRELGLLEELVEAVPEKEDAAARETRKSYRLLVIHGVVIAAGERTADGLLDVTDDISDESRNVAVRAAQAMGIDVAGVDMLTDDIANGSAVITHVEAKPPLHIHRKTASGEVRDLATPIVDALFPGGTDGRIPSVVLTGPPGTERIANALAHILMISGKRVGVTTRNGSTVDGDPIGAPDKREVFASILEDPVVDAAIREASPKDLLQKGLDIDVCSVGAVLGGNAQTEADASQLGQLSNILAAATEGRLIVDADDDTLLRSITGLSPARLCLVSVNPANPAVKGQITAGGRAVTLAGESVSFLDRTKEVFSCPLPPTEVGGRTVLIAAAIAWNMDVVQEDLSAALKTLGFEALNSPLPVRVIGGFPARIAVAEVGQGQPVLAIQSLFGGLCYAVNRINVLLSPLAPVLRVDEEGAAKATVCTTPKMVSELMDAGHALENIELASNVTAALRTAMALVGQDDWVTVFCKDRFLVEAELSILRQLSDRPRPGQVTKPEPEPVNEERPVLWTGPEIAEATGGRWISGNGDAVRATGFNYALALSRHTKPGDLALTVNREQWNISRKMPGVPPSLERQVEAYFRLGAEAVIVHEEVDKIPPDKPVLLVDDTLKALDDLAVASRKRFNGRIIAVTGSVGKTTTRELLKHILGHQGKSFASRKNFNDNKGMPRSMAMTPRDTDWGVYEFSMFACKRSTLLKPHVAVINEIQPVHIEAFHTIEGIADEKALIFEGLEPGGAAVIGRDTPVYHRLRRLVERRGDLRVLSFGTHPEADVRLVDCQLDIDGSDVEADVCGEPISYRMPLAGRHAVLNSLSAIAAVKAAGGNWRKAAADFISMDVLPHRIQREKIPFRDGHITLVDDSFSASPPSVRAGLNVFSTLKPVRGGRRLAVLGRNRELGRRTAEIHAGMARAVIEAGIDRVFTYGDEMLHLRDALPEAMRAYHAVDSKGLIDAVLRELRPDDLVYIKGTKRYLKPIDHLGIILRSDSLNSRVDKVLETPDDPVSEPTETSDAPEEPGTVMTVGDRYTREMEVFGDIDATPQMVLKNNGALDRFDMILVGDTGLGESYSQKVDGKRGKGWLLESRGYGSSLKKMRSALRGSDLVIANLETPVTDLKESPFADVKEYVHWAHVDETPATLKDHNIHVVGLANNHTFDFGRPGFDQTLDVLAKKGFHVFGAGPTLEEARKPFIGETTVGGRRFRFAVFSAFTVMRSYRDRYKCYASLSEGGICPFDVDAIADQIAQFKAVDPELFTIVFPHWGANYRWRSRKQSKMADALIEAGADVIIGHGAHMIQEVERRGGHWIVYSLGNFVFNSPGRYKQEHAPPYSMMARLRVDAGANDGTLLPKLLLYPIVSDNRLTDYQPRFVTDDEFAEVVALLGEQSPDPDDFAHTVSGGRDEHGPYLEIELAPLAASKAS